MLRLLARLLGAYLLLAILGRGVERVGLVRCGCSAECWCRLPVISTVRWVLPYGHR